MAIVLTCKNHPDLRWECKEIAWTQGKGYNGQRSLFFMGKFASTEYVAECKCPVTDLIRASTDMENRQLHLWQK